METVGYLNIYASRPGTDPLPIQTDPALEYQRYRKKVLRRMLLADLPLLIPLLLILLLAVVSWEAAAFHSRTASPDTHPEQSWPPPFC